MKVIGLTGGIASGKSTVTNMLRSLGATVIDADFISRELVLPGSLALREIVEAFGKQVMNKDGSLDRKKLADIVFNDKEKLKRLDEIMLPKIIETINGLLSSYKNAGQAVVMLDAPLLFEAGLKELTDSIWVVYIPESTQLTRLTQRDGLTVDQARQRISSQLSIEDKKQWADIVIDNSGSLDDTYKQVKEFWSRLLHNLNCI